jgi:hypothetical protein
MVCQSFTLSVLDNTGLACLLCQRIPEIRMGDGNQGTGAITNTFASEFRYSVFGNNEMNIVS